MNFFLGSRFDQTQTLGAQVSREMKVALVYDIHTKLGSFPLQLNITVFMSVQRLLTSPITFIFMTFYREFPYCN